MALRVLDPSGEVSTVPAVRPIRRLEALEGLQAGLVWNQHTNSARFWPLFEEAMAAKLRPSRIQKLYKHSTWNPVAPVEIEALSRGIDCAILGVGA